MFYRYPKEYEFEVGFLDNFEKENNFYRDEECKCLDNCEDKIYEELDNEYIESCEA